VADRAEPRSQPGAARKAPAATAVPRTPATFGPIACMSSCFMTIRRSAAVVNQRMIGGWMSGTIAM
jgi:hypothetical protein